jgi:outer membrane protein TolC
MSGMVCRSLPALLLWVLCIIIIFGLAGGCSTEHYKEQADKEVYKIIDKKWRDDFGTKVNYKISDVNASPNDICVEKAVPESDMLSLIQAVFIATAHNRDYQSQKETLYLTTLDLTQARHQFAMQWFGTIDASYTRDSADESVGSDLELGFNQLLATGAQISTSIAIDWARFLTGDPRTSLGSVLSATVVQPLLRGSGRKVVQENLTQAERNVLYQIRSFNHYRKTFVISIVEEYYTVLQRREEVNNAKSNYDMQVASKQRLDMYAEAGRVDRFDVDEAEQSMLRAENNLVTAQQRYEQALDEFKIRLSLPTDADMELDPNELEALRNAGISEPNYTPEVAIETALARRLDLANSADRVDDCERKVMVAANNLGAELNLTGSANVGSAEKTDFTRLQFNNGTYGLGLEADLPFDRKAERNAYREALIAFTQQQRTYQNDVDQVKLEVRDAYRQLREQAESYRIQKLSLELAKKRVESNEMLLDAGRISVRLLLDSQNALVEAQNSYTRALVSHTIAKLNFFRDIGVLQVKPDGMWDEDV